MQKNFLSFVAIALMIVNVGCNTTTQNNGENKDTVKISELQKEVERYVSYKLTTDLSVLTEKERQMLPYLFEAAAIMDQLYKIQGLGDKDTIFEKLTDEWAKKFYAINYGPWNRLDGNKSFIEGIGEKPLGANFYPKDMTKEEFEKFTDPTKTSLYTIIRRKQDGGLESVPYHIAYKEQLEKASQLIAEAAKLAEDAGLKKYLELRSKALITSDYFASDMAWMDMKTNTIDFVVGPIENYEDALFGYKAAFESFILVKDKTWSERLDKYAKILPDLQKILPTDAKYKKESPGTNSDLGAYDAIFYQGDCNAGSKTIAINLPNDEKVQLKKGSRRLQLKNSMRAKFENILTPISKQLVAADQLQYIKFDAFFANVMFHEVAHGLGIKNTITGKGTVRDALKERYSGFEEAKADVLGLWLVTQLIEKGEYQGDVMENYVTFMAGIFRSIRFGAASAHAKGNLLQFNFFMENGAFTINQDGTYSLNKDKMKTAVDALANLILTNQGNGDYENVGKIMTDKGVIGNELQKALDKLKAANIPVDVVWEQGMDVVGLKK